MKLEFSFDDGDELDRNVADLLEKYDFRGVFYMPSRYVNPKLVKELDRRGHEIGGHTVSHPQDMKLLKLRDAENEIIVNKRWLEGLIDKPVTKFCYPRGRYNEDIKQLVRKAGFTEARTTNVLQTYKNSDSYEQSTTIHLYQRTEYGKATMLQTAMTYMNVAEQKKDAGVFHLWGHSWELEKYDLWNEFEQILEVLQEKGHIQ